MALKDLIDQTCSDESSTKPKDRVRATDSLALVLVSGNKILILRISHRKQAVLAYRHPVFQSGLLNGVPEEKVLQSLVRVQI